MMRNRWWLPVLMLALAALACDPPYYDPIHVQAVRADPETPGHAYAQVGNEQASGYYETTDYGQTWYVTEQGFSGDDPNGVWLEMSFDETLSLDYQPLWTFPRQTFRFFFLDDADGQYFKLPLYIMGSAAGDTLYVPMGTEGVLVGPMPGTGSTRAWTLTSAGISTLDPLPLTITDPATVALIVILALAIPPLALIHAYLLSRVWVYVLPPKTARRYALLTAFGLAALAAGAVVIWLTDVNTTYYGIVSIMTLIVIAVDVGITYRLIQQGAITGRARRWMLIVVGLLSLIVPAGVAAIWWLWWAVFLLVFGFAAFQWMLHRRLIRPLTEPPTRRQRWLADRLALEIMGVSILFFIPASVPLGIAPLPEILALPLVVGMVFLASILLDRFISGSVNRLTELPTAGQQAPFRKIFTVVFIAWGASAAGAAILTFVVQGYVYGWFTTLLKP
ncbi:MAG: hypothetical protein K8I60_03455 [Anaerolineae bacterium]|nr:hypothetical protein [Anaerolineae bacterium]